jgi:hypothetical protein
LPSVSVELSGTDAIHVDSRDVTSDEQSGGMERGTECVSPVGGQVPASVLIEPLGAGEVAVALALGRLAPEPFEHATNTAQMMTTARDALGSPCVRGRRARIGGAASRTMLRHIIAAASRGRAIRLVDPEAPAGPCAVREHIPT